MLATEEKTLKLFAIQTVEHYLLQENSTENRTRILKEIAVCHDNWVEICKRTLILAFVDIFNIESLFYAESYDLLEVILLADTIESALIVLVVENFPDWEDSIQEAIKAIIVKAIKQK